MSDVLSLGENVSCTLESESVSCFRPAVHESIAAEHLSSELRAQLAKPLNFPPLASATVPGDNAVIALEYGTPHCEELVRGALAALQDAGIEQDRVTLLLSHGFSKDKNQQGKLNELAETEEFKLLIYDPQNDQETSLLGVTRAGRPVRLSRELCDADLVMSIGLCKISSSEQVDYPSYGALFPLFSDQETIERYRAPIATDSKVISTERQNEVNEAGWLLGVGFTVQVVPNTNGEVAALFAGDPTSVAKAASSQFREIWQKSLDESGNLIVATISGHSEQQTWQNVGRVIELSQYAFENETALVLWTELHEAPGISLKRLAGNEDPEKLERELMRDRHADSWPALLLCRALQRGAVYLRSNLKPEVVESLGMAPMSSTDELARLSRNYKRCLVLEEAQHLLPIFQASVD